MDSNHSNLAKTCVPIKLTDNFSKKHIFRCNVLGRKKKKLGLGRWGDFFHQVQEMVSRCSHHRSVYRQISDTSNGGSVSDDFMGITPPLPASYPNKADNKDTGNNDTPSEEHGHVPYSYH